MGSFGAYMADQAERAQKSNVDLRHELEGLKLDLSLKEAAMRQAMKEITDGWSLVARNTLRKALEN